MKMTVADELEIIDNKIKASKSGSIRCRQISSQIDRQIKKSVKLTNELGKYEYMTGEDLGQKPSVDEQAKFDYSPLGKVFNKGLTEEDKKKDFIREQKILKIRLKAKINNNQKQLKINQTQLIKSQKNYTAKRSIRLHIWKFQFKF